MCGILTFVEELSLKEDLAVSDGDDIGGNVGRHVTSLHTHATGQKRVNPSQMDRLCDGLFCFSYVCVADPRIRILIVTLMRIRIQLIT
jgi:hypothetical protein